MLFKVTRRTRNKNRVLLSGAEPKISGSTPDRSTNSHFALNNDVYFYTFFIIKTASLLNSEENILSTIYIVGRMQPLHFCTLIT